MSEQKKYIEVELAVSLADKPLIQTLRVPVNSSIEDVINCSDLSIDVTSLKVGVFSKVCSIHTVINEGDRVEVYRPLTIDPKTRRQLLAKAKQKVNK